MRKAVKRNKLSDYHKTKRLNLATRRLTPNGSIKDRIFIDEKKFESSSSSKTEYATRLTTEKFDSNMIHDIQTSSIRSNADTNFLCYIGPFGKGKKKD